MARGAMGVDSADYDRSGRQHLLVGNFSDQMLGLYHNEGNGLFVDQAPRSPVARASLLDLAFGVFFFDYDLDGWPDIFAANGHIEEEIGTRPAENQVRAIAAAVSQYGGGKFENVPGVFIEPLVARGAPTAISIATAIWTSSSPPTTAPPICTATMAATPTTGCS